MVQTAPNHFYDVWRAGDANPKILVIHVMDDLLNFFNQLFSVLAVIENDDVGGLPVRRDQGPLPERAFLRVFKTLWAGGYAFDCADAIYGLDLLRQFLNAREVFWR